MAKKKYYQGKKDRMRESKGMDNYYNKMDFANAMHEDMSAMGNLPQSERISMYPKCPYVNQALDDTIDMIDKQKRADINNSSVKSKGDLNNY